MTRRPPPVHWYHLFAGTELGVPVAAGHVRALKEAHYTGEIRMGLVGVPVLRAAAEHYLRSWWIDGIEVCARADAGDERITLAALREWAAGADPAVPVLYAHTKGAFHAGQYGNRWRESMTRHVVGRWQECAELLDGYDAVGCHWLTPEEFPGQVSTPFFAGNFWWARAGYLASLPPPDDGTIAATVRTGGLPALGDGPETWIGLGKPEVRDLLPGFPVPALFGVTG